MILVADFDTTGVHPFSRCREGSSNFVLTEYIVFLWPRRMERQSWQSRKSRGHALTRYGRASTFYHTYELVATQPSKRREYFDVAVARSFSEDEVQDVDRVRGTLSSLSLDIFR